MLLDSEKIQVQMARKGFSISELSENYGCSRQHANALIQKAAAGKSIKPVTAGKLADALGVDVTEIMKD